MLNTNRLPNTNNPTPILLIQPVSHEENLEEEYQLIQKLSGRTDFQLLPIPVQSWNEDLAPWPAPPVFGNEPFGSGAEKTLQQIEAMLPELPAPKKKRRKKD